MAIYSLEPLTSRQWAHIAESCDEPFVESRRESFFSSVTNYDDVTCLICRDRDNVQAVLDRCRNLKFLFVVSVGVERLPFGELKNRQVVVCNVAGVNAEIMSQYVMAYILAQSARVVENHMNQINHVWKRYQTVADVSGKNALIFGAGRVGCLLARKLNAFGIKCIGVKRRPCPVENFDKVVGLPAAVSVIPQADYVVSLLPVTSLTRGYFNESIFSQMKKSAIFVNISRAAVVNMRDLCHALEKGGIGRAIIDVFESEPLMESDAIWDVRNLVITPHSSGRLEDFLDVAIECFCKNYKSYSVSGSAPNIIDLEAGY